MTISLLKWKRLFGQYRVLALTLAYSRGSLGTVGVFQLAFVRLSDKMYRHRFPGVSNPTCCASYAFIRH